MLRALAGRTPAVHLHSTSTADLEWLIGAGVGPLVLRLVTKNQLDVPAEWHEPLQAVDLVARFEMRKLFRTAEVVIRDLRQLGADVTLLKGLSVATRYYEEPHLRTMGDADLLIPRPAIQEAVQLLRSQGYRLSTFAEPKWWDSHHHAPPLIHPELGVTIELHHGLLPPNAAAVGDPAFDVSKIEDRVGWGQLGSERVRRLAPECELALLAAAWGNDLSIFLGRPALLRPLVDAVLLLSRTRETLDWGRLIGWARGTATGTCLSLLLGVLERYEALPIDGGESERLRRDAPIGRVAGRMIQHFVDAHVAGGHAFGRVLTQGNTAAMIRTLLAPRPSWRRWPAVPFNLMFPPSHERRFDVGFQLRRMRSLLRHR